MDKQDDDKDKDRGINQDSKPGDPSSKQNNEREVQRNHNAADLNQRIWSALRDLQIDRAKHAKKKPLLYAKYRAHKNRPPQFFTLSPEEKEKMGYRLFDRIGTQIYPEPLFEEESLRPPKHPKPPIDLFGELKKPKKPTSRKKKSIALPDQSSLPPKKRKILDVNSSKLHPNKGIVIGSEDTVEKPKNEEEEEESEEIVEVGGNLNPFRAMFGKTKKTNMKELNNLKCKFIKDNKILNLEGKMYYMLHKGADKIFKNYHERAREPKRNFYEWTRDCDGLPRFNALKSRAVEPGFTISRIIVHIMFLMSQNKPKEMEAKFQAFEDSLGCVNKDENTLVIWRFIDFLRFADRQMRMVRDWELAPKGKEVMIETEVGGDDDDYLQESFLDPILFSLLQEILRLEIFWGYRRFSCSRMEIINAIPSLEEELGRFEQSRMGLQDEIEYATEEALFGVVSLDWEESDDYLEFALKIDELWHELDE